MNKILLLAGAITLLMTTGCLVSEEHRHRHHGRYERHEEIRVVEPVVIVRPPTVIVR